MADMGQITESLLGGLKSVFSDVAEDELKDSVKDIVKNSSSDILSALSNESAENIGKIISHDIEYLGTSGLKDYLGKTSIFNEPKDWLGVVNEIAKEGGFTKGAKEAAEEAIKDTAEETIKAGAQKTAEKMAEESAEAINNAASKGTPIEDYLSKAGQKKLKTSRYKAKGDYNRYSTAKKFDGMLEEFEKGNYDDPRLKRIGEILGKKPENLNMDEIKYLANKEINDSYNRKSTLGELAGYYKVPQIGVGVFSTAWLVNKLSDDRGEQTNAQLYNQQPY